jgi:glycosyltransferase involved in cell wall biosynthesis
MHTTFALCIPAYNAVKHLPRLFESVRKQTVPFDEVWVYDDASSDETAAIATLLGALVIRGSVNKGCSAGKNVMLERVGATWVHFHDADDILMPEFVERARKRIANSEFDALIFDYEQVHEVTGTRMSHSDFAASSLLDDPIRYMLTKTVNNGGVYSTAFLRKILGFDLDPDVRYNEDRAFHLRLAEAGARFAIEPYLGSRFFFNPDSMSSSNRAACCAANQEITQRFENRNRGLYRDEIAAVSWNNAACLASCLDWPAADACVRLAIKVGRRVPTNASGMFKLICLINPYWAVRLREVLIRLFKPRYRDGYPDSRMKQFSARSRNE